MSNTPHTFYISRIKQTLLCLLLPLSFFLSSHAFADESVNTENFTHALEQLQSKSYKEKEQAIEQLVLSKDQRVKSILEAMLNARLFFIKEDKKLVIGIKNQNGFAITDVLTQKAIGDIDKSSLIKVKVNNKLRRILRSSIATLSLFSSDADERLSAVKSMYGKVDDIDILKKHLENEKNRKVRTEISTLISINDLNSENKETQLAAIKSLSSSLQPEVKNILVSLKDHSEPQIVKASQAALKNIDEKLSVYEKINTLFFGLSLGSVLVLAAIGLAITFGVMGVINMAHGELIMLGAYTTYVIQQLMPHHIGLSLLVAVPAAFIVSGLVGILIERVVIRHLYGRPLETLLATFGISLILQQAVRSVFSPLNRSVETPGWMSGSLEINPALSLTYNRLYIILFCLAVFALLFLIIKRTSLGLSVRAVSQNRSMARAMGIRASRVDALTFGLGSGIAGIAGVALSQLTNVGPNLGQAYIIDSFMVVVFGGVGNLWGTLISGFTLGVANKFMEPWAGAVLAKIFVLVFIILFIQKRPRGLFPQKGRAAES
jgi:urea transport system permease protein